MRELYGYRNIPWFPGSVHEGEELDDAELVLHELGHQTLLPADFVFTLGNMGHANRLIGNYIDTLDDWRRDLHEIRAVAIELNVARRLGLRLRFSAIIAASQKNTEMYKHKSFAPTYRRLVAKARKSLIVMRCEDTIMALIAEVQKNKT